MSYYKENDYLGVYTNFEGNPYWCLNEQGNIYNIYNVKCRNFYLNIQKAKSNIYDNNYTREKKRTIFVTDFYKQFDYGDSSNIYTMCIEFFDPITNGSAYACTDINQDDLTSAFNKLNSNIHGYFFVSTIGFNYIFYFPQSAFPQTITDNIYSWDLNYFLEEKTYFFNNIQKTLTSNYNNQIGNSMNEEVFVNGKNCSEQYFYINNE